LNREIAINERSQTELRQGLVQSSATLDESNGGELLLIHAISNMAIYAIVMTKLEINDKLVKFFSTFE
jgi:hypothetical protein